MNTFTLQSNIKNEFTARRFGLITKRWTPLAVILAVTFSFVFLFWFYSYNAIYSSYAPQLVKYHECVDQYGASSPMCTVLALK